MCKYTEETLESENRFLVLKEKHVAKQIGRMATMGLAPIMFEGIRSYYLYQLANVLGLKVAKEAFSLNEESGTLIRRGTRRWRRRISPAAGRTSTRTIKPYASNSMISLFAFPRTVTKMPLHATIIRKRGQSPTTTFPAWSLDQNPPTLCQKTIYVRSRIDLIWAGVIRFHTKGTGFPSIAKIASWKAL